MDETISRGILFGNHPPKGIYFTVALEYVTDNPALEGIVTPGTTLESTPIADFNTAMEVSDGVVEKLHETFGEHIQIMEVDPKAHDGFHVYVSDPNAVPLARVGVEMHDYRKATLH